MDRTHFLATQAFPRDRHGPATRTEIDAFYDVHGLEIFARASRLRRSVRALAARRLGRLRNASVIWPPRPRVVRIGAMPRDQTATGIDPATAPQTATRAGSAADRAAIIEVIRAETQAFVDLDFDAWSACWLHSDRTRSVSVSPSTGLSTIRGGTTSPPT
ncbi:MAG: hypothetical protein R3D59_00965 [Paracoccaceae bacterium]